jgi:hypothetical protein
VIDLTDAPGDDSNANNWCLHAPDIHGLKFEIRTKDCATKLFIFIIIIIIIIIIATEIVLNV